MHRHRLEAGIFKHTQPMQEAVGKLRALNHVREDLGDVQARDNRLGRQDLLAGGKDDALGILAVEQDFLHLAVQLDRPAMVLEAPNQRAGERARTADGKTHPNLYIYGRMM